MADKTITISVRGGALQVSADPFTIKPQVNTLCFKCAEGELAILFDNDRSPFTNGKKAHAAHKGEATTKIKIRNLTPKERKAGVGDPLNGATFKYAVAVLVPGSGGVLTLDPDVIIDDPGGGG